MAKSFFRKKKADAKKEHEHDSSPVPVKKKITEKKVVRFFDKLTDRILIFICLILLCLGSYALIDTIHIYYHANDTSLLTYKPKVEKDGTVRDPLSLPGAVGWLTLDGTHIDYPVMQGSDNSAYLNKDPYGNYSLSGSLFLDAANKADFTDQYCMIYGHHMEHSTMFGALDEYLNADYFAKHRTGSIIIGNKSYKLVFFAAVECSAYQKEIFDVKYGGALSYILNNAEILYADDVTEYDQILALSTCQEADSDQRTVIFAVITGGPGMLNSDGTQKSTTAGDVNTGAKNNHSTYLYWMSILVALAIGAATVAMMRNDKNKQKLVTDENSNVLDAVYTPVKDTKAKTAEQPMAPPVVEPIVQTKESPAEPIAEVPEIKLIEMSKAASIETKEPEAKTPAKKKPARKPRKKTSDTVTAKTAEKPKRKATTKKSVKPVAVEVAPVEKIEVAPIIEKPKRKTTKKTAKPAEVAVASVEKAETKPVVEKPKRKSTKKTVKIATVDSAPVEKAEITPVVEKPKRKSTKKTAKPTEVAVATVEKTEDAPVVEKPKRKPAKKAVKPAIVEAPIEKVEAKPTVEKPKRKTTRKAAGKAVEPAPVEKIEAAPVVEKPKRKAPVKKKTVKSADKTVDQPKVKRTRKASTAIDAKKEAAKQPEKKPVVRKKKASATTERKPAKTAKKKVKPVNNNGEQ